MSFKKIVLAISGLSSLFWLTIGIKGTYFFCGGVYGTCVETLYQLETYALIAVSFFLFSLITYFMRKEVFDAWVRFALVWTAVSIIAIFFMPELGGGGFGPSISVGKGDVALLTSVLFVVISGGIILWTWWVMRKRD